MPKPLREIIPLKDLIDLDEIKLSRITRALDAREPVGTVSPERSGMNAAQKADAHTRMQGALERESKKGMISWTGNHAGRYKYDATEKPSQEGSYVLRPGKHPKAKDNFHRILTHLGKNFDQESVMKMRKRGEGPASGAFYFPGKGGNSKEVRPLGHVHYNAPLDKGDGDTRLKGTRSTFTVKKDKKNDEKPK